MSSRVSSRKSSVCLPKFYVCSLGCAPKKIKCRSTLSPHALLRACPPMRSSCLLGVSQRFQAVSQVFLLCLHPIALLTVPRRSSSPNSLEDGLETNENYAKLLLKKPFKNQVFYYKKRQIWPFLLPVPENLTRTAFSSRKFVKLELLCYLFRKICQKRRFLSEKS